MAPKQQQKSFCSTEELSENFVEKFSAIKPPDEPDMFSLEKCDELEKDVKFIEKWDNFLTRKYTAQLVGNITIIVISFLYEMLLTDEYVSYGLDEMIAFFSQHKSHINYSPPQKTDKELGTLRCLLLQNEDREDCEYWINFSEVPENQFHILDLMVRPFALTDDNSIFPNPGTEHDVAVCHELYGKFISAIYWDPQEQFKSITAILDLFFSEPQYSGQNREKFVSYINETGKFLEYDVQYLENILSASFSVNELVDRIIPCLNGELVSAKMLWNQSFIDILKLIEEKQYVSIFAEVNHLLQQKTPVVKKHTSDSFQPITMWEVNPLNSLAVKYSAPVVKKLMASNAVTHEEFFKQDPCMQKIFAQIYDHRLHLESLSIVE